jgi:hypothetical protein
MGPLARRQRSKTGWELYRIVEDFLFQVCREWKAYDQYREPKSSRY